MNIYNYDNETKEYLFTSVAEADPAETEKQGKFIPLIPANATLIAIASYNTDNQIPVFENDNWVVKSDYRKNYYKVDGNLNVEEITTIGEQTGFYIVDKEVGEDIKINPDWYKIVEDNVVKKTSEEYEQEQIAKEKARILELSMTRSDFFDATIKAFGADEADLLPVITEILASIPETFEIIPDVPNAIATKMALNNYKNAAGFYRKHPLFVILSNRPMKISEELTITITSEQWDRFFDETNKRNPDAYKELLPVLYQKSPIEHKTIY